MSETVNSTHVEIRAYVDRLENLAVQRARIDEGMKSIFADVAARGFSVKILKALIKERAGDPAQLSEEGALLELYRKAVA